MAGDKENELAPRALPLSSKARATWISYANRVESELAPDGGRRSIAGLANKLPEHAARLAAVLSLVEDLHCAEVSSDHMARGVVLAEHYASQRRGHSNEPYDSDLAAKGEKIHAQYCSQCHVRPDDPEVADALGIPLHGQRGVYLRYALQSYKDGRRKNLLDAMAAKLEQLDSDDIEALVNYFAGYPDQG